MTAGAVYPQPDSSGQSSFLVKIGPAGDRVIYSSYLPFTDSIIALAVDAQGEEYVASAVGPQPSSFHATPGAFQAAAPRSSGGGVVLKISADGSETLYATFLSGSTPGTEDTPYSIAVDSAGDALITGGTSASGFPVTPGAYETTQLQGGAFVAELNPTASALIYSTYLSGSDDIGTAIRIDAQGGCLCVEYCEYILAAIAGYGGRLRVETIGLVGSVRKRRLPGQDEFERQCRELRELCTQCNRNEYRFRWQCACGGPGRHGLPRDQRSLSAMLRRRSGCVCAAVGPGWQCRRGKLSGRFGSRCTRGRVGLGKRARGGQRYNELHGLPRCG